MSPTAENWSGLVNKKITLDLKLSAKPEGDGVMVREFPVAIDAGDPIKLSRTTNGDVGLWVPYAETKAVVGYLVGGQSFVASGPFSGCEFAVGGDGGGRVFAAHIARQSGSTAVEDWDKYANSRGLKTWYRNKIPLPQGPSVSYACSYVFATFAGGGIKSLVRVDVKVTAMGGSDGEVFHVHKFK